MSLVTSGALVINCTIPTALLGCTVLRCLQPQLLDQWSYSVPDTVAEQNFNIMYPSPCPPPPPPPPHTPPPKKKKHTKKKRGGGGRSGGGAGAGGGRAGGGGGGGRGGRRGGVTVP